MPCSHHDPSSCKVLGILNSPTQADLSGTTAQNSHSRALQRHLSVSRGACIQSSRPFERQSCRCLNDQQEQFWPAVPCSKHVQGFLPSITCINARSTFAQTLICRPAAHVETAGKVLHSCTERVDHRPRQKIRVQRLIAISSFQVPRVSIASVRGTRNFQQYTSSCDILRLPELEEIDQRWRRLRRARTRQLS